MCGGGWGVLLLLERLPRPPILGIPHSTSAMQPMRLMSRASTPASSTPLRWRASFAYVVRAMPVSWLHLGLNGRDQRRCWTTLKHFETGCVTVVREHDHMLSRSFKIRLRFKNDWLSYWHLPACGLSNSCTLHPRLEPPPVRSLSQYPGTGRFT